MVEEETAQGRADRRGSSGEPATARGSANMAGWVGNCQKGEPRRSVSLVRRSHSPRARQRLRRREGGPLHVLAWGATKPFSPNDVKAPPGWLSKRSLAEQAGHAGGDH